MSQDTKEQKYDGMSLEADSAENLGKSEDWIEFRRMRVLSAVFGDGIAEDENNVEPPNKNTTERKEEKEEDSSRLQCLSAVFSNVTQDVFDLGSLPFEDQPFDSQDQILSEGNEEKHAEKKEDEGEVEGEGEIESMKILDIEPKSIKEESTMNIIADFSKDDFEPKDITVSFTLRMKPTVKNIEIDEKSKSCIITTEVPPILSLILNNPSQDFDHSLLTSQNLDIELNFFDPKTNRTVNDTKVIPLSSMKPSEPIIPEPQTPCTPVIRSFHKPLRFRRGTAASTKMVHRLRQRSMFPITQTELKMCSPKTLASFLFSTIEFIEKNPSEGIFRKSGSRLGVGDVMRRIESGFPCNLKFLKQINNIHVVGSMFKLWMSELPTPLFSELFKPMIEDESCYPYSLETAIPIIIKQFKLIKKIILVKVLTMFRSIEIEKEVTKMDAKNLSIVFTPNLYTKDVISLLRNKKMNERAMALTMFLITNVSKIEETIFPKKHQFHKKPKRVFIKSFNE